MFSSLSSLVTYLFGIFHRLAIVILSTQWPFDFGIKHFILDSLISKVSTVYLVAVVLVQNVL